MPITQEQLDELLQGIDPKKEQTADVVTEALLRDIRALPRRVIELSLGSRSELGARASQLLNHLDEAAIGLLENTTSTSQELQLSRLFVQSYKKRHGDAVARLSTALSDDRPVTAKPNRGPVEQENPPGRVCDTAYAQLRLLTHLSESAATAHITIDEFLNLPNEDKDREIKKARDLHQWTALVQEVEEAI